MVKRIIHIIGSETFRYLIFGVLTVAVNISSYHILAWKLSALSANTVAFFIAVLFAYWTNSRFVFRVPRTVKNFTQFMAMRIGTLLVDDGGMMVLLAWGWNDFWAKCAVNFIIILINYLFSKLLIFKKEHTKENAK